jgi:SAM-dependent methyltransferase
MVEPGPFEERYFREVYPCYGRQNPPRKLAFYRSMAETALAGVAHPRILDIGCATGLFLASLDPRWQRFGCDVSAYAVSAARAQAPAACIEEGRATAIPFRERFDLVTAFDVLEHVPDLPAAEGSLRAALRPGGSLLFVVPVYDGPAGPLIRALDRDPTHVHTRSREFWLNWAGAFLHIERWLGIFRYLAPGNIYLHLPTVRLRRCAPAIAVLARAPLLGAPPD